jgi:hypothetical protein
VIIYLLGLMQVQRNDNLTKDPKQIALENKRRTVSIRYRLRDDCAICMNSMMNVTTSNLPCGHSYHLKCFKTMQSSQLKSRRQCPICRQTFESAPVKTTDVWSGTGLSDIDTGSDTE